jgi:hypothetical protein
MENPVQAIIIIMWPNNALSLRTAKRENLMLLS